MASSKDYYDILGISRSASAEEIKSAYRKLARDHHPDMVSDADKANAEKKFKEINEAYQVLSNPEKKKMYDQFGHAGVGGASGPGPGAGGFGQQGGQWGPFSYSYTSGGGQGFDGVDPFEIFEEVFGFRGFGGRSRQPKKGKNLYYEIRVDFEDAVHGAEREINIESGKTTVKIPKGIRNGTEMRFAGKGMPGPNNLPPGDLYISFRVSSPKEFQIVGSDVGMALEIDFTQAILGDTVEVKVVDPEQKSGIGTAKVKIPAGTQHGTRIKLSGKGMPKLNSSGRGDMIVQTFITMPKKVNRKQRKILEEYRRA